MKLFSKYLTFIPTNKQNEKKKKHPQLEFFLTEKMPKPAWARQTKFERPRPWQRHVVKNFVEKKYHIQKNLTKKFEITRSLKTLNAT